MSEILLCLCYAAYKWHIFYKTKLHVSFNILKGLLKGCTIFTTCKNVNLFASKVKSLINRIIWFFPVLNQLPYLFYLLSKLLIVMFISSYSLYAMWSVEIISMVILYYCIVCTCLTMELPVG